MYSTRLFGRLVVSVCVYCAFGRHIYVVIIILPYFAWHKRVLSGRIYEVVERHQCWACTCCTNGTFVTQMRFEVIGESSWDLFWLVYDFLTILLAGSGGHIPTLLWHIPQLIGGAHLPKSSNPDAICSSISGIIGTFSGLCILLSYWACSHTHAGTYYYEISQISHRISSHQHGINIIFCFFLNVISVVFLWAVYGFSSYLVSSEHVFQSSLSDDGFCAQLVLAYGALICHHKTFV